LLRLLGVLEALSSVAGHQHLTLATILFIGVTPMRWLTISTGVLGALLVIFSTPLGAQSTTNCNSSDGEAIRQQRFELEALKRELLRQSEIIDNLTAQIEERQQKEYEDQDGDQDQEPQLAPMPFIPTGSPMMSVQLPICRYGRSTHVLGSHSALICKRHKAPSNFPHHPK
jgi:hypothetical protein